MEPIVCSFQPLDLVELLLSVGAASAVGSLLAVFVYVTVIEPFARRLFRDGDSMESP